MFKLLMRLLTWPRLPTGLPSTLPPRLPMTLPTRLLMNHAANKLVASSAASMAASSASRTTTSAAFGGAGALRAPFVVVVDADEAAVEAADEATN